MIALQHDEKGYFLYFESTAYPNHRWRLWFPELFIFNQDQMRAAPVGDPRIEVSDSKLVVKGQTAPGEWSAGFEVRYRIDKNRIELDLAVTNLGTEAWGHYANFATCLSSTDAPDFVDEAGANTWIFPEGAIPVSVRSQVEPVKDQTYHHFPVGHRHDPADGDERRSVDRGCVARESRDGSASLWYAWDRPARVDVNFNHLTCIHSHPAIGPLGPAESCRARGIIALIPHSVADAFKELPEVFRKYPAAARFE